MNYYLIILSLLVTFLLNLSTASASTFNFTKCTLPKTETLVIGCTKDCGKFNRKALYKFANKSGYKVKLVDLYSERQSIDIDSVDGILIPGGADINPKYYIQDLNEELKEKIKSLDHLVDYSESGDRRDPFEYELLQKYFSNTKLASTPILGICRGMQMLGVSQGIPLYVDIKAELNIRNRRYKLDKIFLQSKDSSINKIMKDMKFRAVELHHQGPRVDYFKKNKAKWPNINLTGLSNSGKIAEVLEWTDRPVLGVQFHPEYTFGKVRRRIFSWLLNQACHKKTNEKK